MIEVYQISAEGGLTGTSITSLEGMTLVEDLTPYLPSYPGLDSDGCGPEYKIYNNGLDELYAVR